MRSNSCFDSGVPRASESSVLRYLEKIFRTKFTKDCTSFADAMTQLSQSDIDYIPEGLNVECSFIAERFNVISSVWNINAKSDLAGVAYELGDQGYMLVNDSNLHGAESLFLVTTSICTDSNQMREDLKSVIDSWASHGAPKILIGSFKNQDGSTLHLVAAQLITLVDK